VPTNPLRLSPLKIAGIFVALFIVAILLDVPLSTWTHNVGLAGYLKEHALLALIIRIPGNYAEYTLPLGVLIFLVRLSRDDRRNDFWTGPVIVLLAGILSGINAALKLCIGRIRPYHGVPPFELHPFSRAIVDAEAGFSFPSGDASLAFAMAASLSFVVPRLWPLWWTLAIIVGLERIAENAHYPSDVVAGAALGVACAYIARWFVRIFGNSPPSPGTPVEGGAQGVQKSESRKIA
jgi:membrane-associated phospholipid phosphatase